MAFQMNKQRQAHMEAGDVKETTGQHHPPHISIHSHAKGHTVHVMHHDGTHTKHELAHGDTEGIAAHIHEHLGSGGQPVSEGGPAPIEEEEFS